MSTRQSGISTVELLVVVAMAAMLVTLVVGYTLPQLIREEMRAAAQDLRSCLQFARVEAISRNRPCRCVLDPAAHSLVVLDTRDTASTADDLELFRADIADQVIFARPDAGAPITLAEIGASGTYHAVFAQDGSVTSGIGEVTIFGGDRFGRVALYAAGGTEQFHWDGAVWRPGP